MKKLLVMLLICLPLKLHADVPYCENIDTPREGWRLPTGEEILGACQNRAAFCNAVGQRGEGWYAAPFVEARLLSQTRCANAPSYTRPICVNYGTASEGWLTQDGRHTLGRCDLRVVRCDMIGTRAEGWYVLTLEPSLARLLRYATCGYED